jgi:glucose-6-phosphate isomerase
VSLIRLDTSCAQAERVGAQHGLTPGELAALAPAAARALASVRAPRGQGGELGWLDLPYQHAACDELLEHAAQCQGRYDNVVVLGIGGSALGNIALHTALNSPFHNLDRDSGVPRLFVLDNIDPDLVGEFLDCVDPAATLFNVISKSGATPETLAQFLILRERMIERLGEAAHREHVVITTDAERGALREIARREEYRSFEVPAGVGGRYSVLSSVGLFSSALVGIDVKGLLAGAAAMDECCQSAQLEHNPALAYAAHQWLLHSLKGKSIAVNFPYSGRLRDLSAWYAQLLAESLGKRLDRAGRVVHRGPTPLCALGATDQHSLQQLFVEGPADKWFTFSSVQTPDHALAIPHAHEDLEDVGYLCGRELVELYRAEREGTRRALTQAGRPSVELQLGAIDAHSVGQLIFFYELAVALMGELYDVDAFDQPGIEAGKRAAFELLGRPGYGA